MWGQRPGQQATALVSGAPYRQHNAQTWYHGKGETGGCLRLSQLAYGAGGTFANRFPVLISEMRPLFTSKSAAILL